MFRRLRAILTAGAMLACLAAAPAPVPRAGPVADPEATVVSEPTDLTGSAGGLATSPAGRTEVGPTRSAVHARR